MASVGATALAKFLGVSRERVYQLLREGKITRNADGSFDPHAVARQLGRNLDPQQQPKAKVSPPAAAANPFERQQKPDPEAPITGGSAHELFNRARAAKEIAIAKERQFALRRLEGQLLDAADVTQSWTKLLIRFNNRLLQIPDRLARRVAASSDERECRQLIHDEMISLLNTLRETKADEIA